MVTYLRFCGLFLYISNTTEFLHEYTLNKYLKLVEIFLLQFEEFLRWKYVFCKIKLNYKMMMFSLELHAIFTSFILNFLFYCKICINNNVSWHKVVFYI